MKMFRIPVKLTKNHCPKRRCWSSRVMDWVRIGRCLGHLKNCYPLLSFKTRVGVAGKFKIMSEYF